MAHTNQTLCDVFTEWGTGKGWYVFLLTLQILILLANVILNGILCHLLKRLKKSTYRPCHTFIWHQVIVNFLVAAFCQLTVVLKLLPWTYLYRAALSQFSTVSFAVLRAVTSWSISLLSIDRYRYIVNYSTYREKTVCSCIAFSLLFVWIPSVVMGLSPLSISSGNDSVCVDTCHFSQSVCSSTAHTVYNVFYIILFFLLPTAVMGKTYYSVFTSARKHRIRRIELQKDGRTAGGQRRTIPKSRILQEVKAARVLIIALTAYMLCFTPYFVSITLSVFEFWTENEPPIGFLVFCQILLFSHTLFDPLLHGFGDRAVKELWLDTFCKKRSSDIVTRFPFGAQADTLCILSHVSGITIQPTSPDGCSSLFSREDLVSTDFLEIYRTRRSVESIGIRVRPQRQSWVSVRGRPVPAWVDHSASQSVCRPKRKISHQTLKTLALRTIGEAAAALVSPQITSTFTEEQEIFQLHQIGAFSASSITENCLPDVD